VLVGGVYCPEGLDQISGAALDTLNSWIRR
jgi:hypothetical protein